MPDATIEQRLERLERIVDKMRRGMHREPGRDDWLSTVGAFADDPIAGEIIEAALQLREQERRQLGP